MARRFLGDDGGEVAARGVARHGDALRVDAEAFGVGVDPPEGGDSVVDRGGEDVFGRAAIVDVEDDDLAVGAQGAGHRVVGLR